MTVPTCLLTVAVAEAGAQMGEDGQLGPVTCRAVLVTCDQALDLASPLIGGPVVTLDLAGARLGFMSEFHYQWRLSVRALIEAEAREALGQARLLLLDGLGECGPVLRQQWRLRDGQLCLPDLGGAPVTG